MLSADQTSDVLLKAAALIDNLQRMGPMSQERYVASATPVINGLYDLAGISPQIANSFSK